jgi:uncharacterized membrane protein YhaH (DUF805 family)
MRGYAACIAARADQRNFMSSANPYAPPRAAVDDVDPGQTYQPVRFWSAQGRIGRLRYLAYSMGGYVAYVLALFVVGFIGAATQSAGVASLAIWVLLVPYLVFFVLLSIQRSHDMDVSGWLSMVALIPLVGLVFLFIPGTRGANRFGAPPPLNTTGVKVMAALPLVVFVVGIVAAIALPAYVDYQKRAAAAR